MFGTAKLTSYAPGIILLCLASAVLPAGAQDSTTGWGLEQLMQRLAQNKGGAVDFSEDNYDAMLTKPLHSSGVLIYTPPDHLEKNTILPKAQSVIVDGPVLIMRDAAHSRTIRLEDYPQIGALVESLRATLGGDLATLRKTNDVNLEGAPGRWQLNLIPNDPALRERIREIHITGSDAALQTVEVLEVNGDRSMMTIAKAGP